MRSGCQWDTLPPASSTQEHLRRLVSALLCRRRFEAISAVLVTECDQLGSVQWEWQAADGWLGKARFGGEKGRQKPEGPGKGHEEVHAGGSRAWALGAGHRGRTVHECKMLRATIQAIVVRSGHNPRPNTATLESGRGMSTRRVARRRSMPSIPQTSDGSARRSKPSDNDQRSTNHGRWVDERTVAFLSKCRGILIRGDKMADQLPGAVDWLVPYVGIDASTARDYSLQTICPHEHPERFRFSF